MLPAAWIAESLKPCPLNSNYGLLWWVNTGGVRWPSVPHTSFAASGAGANLVWVDPEHDIVAVLRWIDPASIYPFLRLLMAAMT